MPKRPTKFKNPDQDPDLTDFDVIRRVTGGETPAELMARREEQLRRRPVRILDLARDSNSRGKSRSKKPNS